MSALPAIPAVQFMSLHQKMHGIASEIAKGIFDVGDILLRYEVTLDQFDSIQRHPQFGELVKQARIEWDSADNTPKRTKLKAAVLFEEALPELNNRLHDRAEPLSSKVELAKLLSRVGDLDKGGAAVGGGSEMFKIEINLGNAKLGIEKHIPVKTIEAEVE